jgi:hypothetical protein
VLELNIPSHHPVNILSACSPYFHTKKEAYDLDTFVKLTTQKVIFQKVQEELTNSQGNTG